MRVFFLLLLIGAVREKTDGWAKDQKKSERRGVVGGTTALPCHARPEGQHDMDFEWTFRNETNVIIDYTNHIDNEGYERVKFIGDLTKGNASITIEDLFVSTIQGCTSVNGPTILRVVFMMITPW
uniref:Immunoglobulin V-set domain-containing protein n=1 Tax=Eptatretus burgeri TaxID=7764 RepID=A0A8C4N7S5_EPTBU